MFYDYVITKPSLDEALKHYGVLGMKWGHRKLDRKKVSAERARKRVGKISERENKRYDKKIKKAEDKYKKLKQEKARHNKYYKDYDKGYQKYINVLDDYRKTQDKAESNKAYKNTKKYKQASSAYKKQSRSDLAYRFTPASLLGVARPVDYTAAKYRNEKQRKKKNNN